MEKKKRETKIKNNTLKQSNTIPLQFIIHKNKTNSKKYNRLKPLRENTQAN